GVTGGRPGTPMPAFAKAQGRSLTAAQIHVLLHEIKGIPYRILQKREGEETKVEIVPEEKGISPQWGSAGQAFVNPPPYLAPEANAGGAGARRDERATKLLARARAPCHGSVG